MLVEHGTGDLGVLLESLRTGDALAVFQKLRQTAVDVTVENSLLVVAILAIGPASDLAIALVNRTVTNVLGPRPLPRLDLDDGVPSRLRTLVVVPTLLTSEADVEAQIGGLEVHYLGNREGDLRFALLSDWLDAPSEHVPGDDDLLSAAAFLTMGIPLIVFFSLQRYFVSGLLAGSVKS